LRAAKKAEEPPSRQSLLYPDMRFLKWGYFLLVKEEIERTMPSQGLFPTTDVLDFFCVPVLLEIAKSLNIPVCNYHITTQPDFKLPAIIYPLNPFMWKPKIVESREKLKRAMDSLTRNHTYPVCVEKIDGKLRKERVIEGKARRRQSEEIANKLWERFGVPAFTMYFMENKKEVRLSGVVPLVSSKGGGKKNGKDWLFHRAGGSA